MLARLAIWMCTSASPGKDKKGKGIPMRHSSLVPLYSTFQNGQNFQVKITLIFYKAMYDLLSLWKSNALCIPLRHSHLAASQ